MHARFLGKDPPSQTNIEIPEEVLALYARRPREEER
jgi:hypothetical protein